MRTTKSSIPEWVVAALAVGGVLAISTVIWVVGSAYEAAAYRRVTGKNVSTFDAMFLDLRIQEGVSPQR